VNAIKVPQRAVLESPTGNGKIVYLAADDGKGGLKADVRPVEVGEWLGDSWIVRSGLKAGDRVIVEGTAKIFAPGMPVQIGPPPGAPGAGGPGADKGGAPAKDAPAAKDAPKEQGKAEAPKAAPAKQ